MNKVIYPFLFAVFPILFLFVYNIDEVSISNLLLPIVVMLLTTSVLFFLLRLFLKNYEKAGLIATFFLVLFYSYGRIMDLFLPKARTDFRTNLALMSVWLFCFIVGTFLVSRIHRNLLSSTKFLNVVAILLVVFYIANIGIHEFSKESRDAESTQITEAALNTYPDIYYIILDAYTNQSILGEVINYDNSDFVNYLVDKNFYVATKSVSNYASTPTSLSSSLNMNYINEDVLTNKTYLWSSIGNSKVSQFLRKRGYHCIYVDGGLHVKNMSKYAEVYSCTKVFGVELGDFTYELCKTTLLAPFGSFFSSISDWGSITQYGINRVLYAFDMLADIPNIEGPTFTYAHILCPHSPALFDANGPKKFVMFSNNKDFYPQGYCDNLDFINIKLETLVDSIISKSGSPVVIILQGDHGISRTKQGVWVYAYGILNAYYFSTKDYSQLCETTSPVNSFRIVFNQYFDVDFELLREETK